MQGIHHSNVRYKQYNTLYILLGRTYGNVQGGDVLLPYIRVKKGYCYLRPEKVKLFFDNYFKKCKANGCLTLSSMGDFPDP